MQGDQPNSIRGKSGERERERMREEERTERLFMFHLELPSAGDPWTTPPGSLCGLWMHACTHLHTIAHIRFHSCITFYCSCIFAFLISCCVFRHLIFGQFKCLTIHRIWLVCLFYTPSRAEAFTGIVSSHRVFTQHCL